LSVARDTCSQLERDHTFAHLQNRFEEMLIMTVRKSSALALAAAAAVLFASVSVTAGAAEEGKVKCEGVNSCKGQSACKTAKNSCKGQNACKGAGFLELTKAECDAAHAKAHEKKGT
jgi:hypothetical protein